MNRPEHHVARRGGINTASPKKWQFPSLQILVLWSIGFSSQNTSRQGEDGIALVIIAGKCKPAGADSNGGKGNKGEEGGGRGSPKSKDQRVNEKNGVLKQVKFSVSAIHLCLIASCRKQAVAKVPQ
ncbi:hypothetical protein TraAM80_04629 [Trypanosoma rangeli]|uniref:Uncharacterized protein n=1 Tax=Trypanosoma rangeli TaxID=5698 RepID=A0A422NIZ5_TRYRA|nr:uncharacterized protein TraAM80_04629 [Trypanosoma rangeli]RNF05419.1 hypothetical protein TraAM80_04629 [Trypanosoma rangeli]|eukprot:RNF05419.1 hypothetical protein TraAM80_04629 [Trypanosoma rangeli]